MRDLEVTANGRAVLARVSFDAKPGEIVGVLGPNGSGKTTLLEAIAGLRFSHGGVVAVGEKPLTNFRTRATMIGYMPDDDVLPEETTVGVALGLHAGDALVGTFGLASLLRARATEISRGESKRAKLCAALKQGRPVLLLDEPFAAFDPRQMRSLLPLVREAVRDVAVVMTIHQMHVAESLADRLLLLSEGRSLAFASLDELRARVGVGAASLDEVFLRLLDEEEEPLAVR